MSLMAKLTVLSSLLVLVAIMSVGVPSWAVAQTDCDILGAQSLLMSYLDTLDWIRNGFRAEIQGLASGSVGAADRDRFAQHSEQVQTAVRTLEQSPAFHRFAGTGLVGVLMRHLQLTRDRFDRAVENLGREQSADLVRSAEGQYAKLEVVFDLIREQLNEDFYAAISHSLDSKVIVNQIFLASFLAASLVCALALLLLRRWILVPVLALRQATREISLGNLSYRIAVTGRDELGALSQEVNQMAATIAIMQAEAVAQERFSTLGQIARTLAHNLRNPLAGIRSIAEATRLELDRETQFYEDQTLIIQIVDRFERWLNELLRSSTPVSLTPRMDSPAAVLIGVREAHLPLARSKSVELELDIENAPKQASFDAAYLEQALVALTTNALEAVVEGGTVCIGAEHVAGNGRWRVTVADSGPGLEPEVAQNACRPYFTTKPHGTGCGLALVSNVVQAHRGTIEIGRSARPGGAEFILELQVRHDESNHDGAMDGTHHRT